jgi:hypothetical protein
MEQQGKVARAVADATIATIARETAQVPVLPVEARRSFEGREPSLKGFIYDSTGERSPDQYILKTTKEIINYVGRMYTKYTADFTQAVRDLELTMPEAPVDPDPANTIAFEMWKLDLKEHRVKEQEYENFWAGLYTWCLVNVPKHSRTNSSRTLSSQAFTRMASDYLSCLTRFTRV